MTTNEPSRKPSDKIMDDSSEPSAVTKRNDQNSNLLATKLRLLRRNGDLTLQQLSKRCGISPSALSKIENGQLSPTYEKIAALASGLGVDVGELFSPIAKPAVMGRRSVTRWGAGVHHHTKQYVYEMLHPDFADKRFIPLVTVIKAHEATDFPALLSHEGEEMIFVISGKVTLHSDCYSPLELEVGDSCYFDSTMGHACVSSCDGDATVLWVTSRESLSNAIKKRESI